MSEIASLSHESIGDIEVFRVVGEVDVSNVSTLSEQLLGSVSNQARAVILDLSNTTYIDSSGISLIFDAASGVKDRRRELRLVVVPSSFVAEVLSAVSIDESVPIDAVLEDALEALR